MDRWQSEAELSGPEAVKLAVLKLGRPSIPRHWDAKLAELLRSCWVNDPAARPSFAAVLEVLHDVFKLAIGATYEDVWLWALPTLCCDDKTYSLSISKTLYLSASDSLWPPRINWLFGRMRGGGLRQRGDPTNKSAPHLRSGKCSECSTNWAFQGGVCRSCAHFSTAVYMALAPDWEKVDEVDAATGAGDEGAEASSLVSEPEPILEHAAAPVADPEPHESVAAHPERQPSRFTLAAKSAEHEASEALFSRHDVDVDGRLSLVEVATAMAEVVGALASKLTAQFARSFDADASGSLDRKEFDDLYCTVVPTIGVVGEVPALAAQHSAAPVPDAAATEWSLDAFERFDLDGDGKIEMIEALVAMKELLGPLASDFVSQYVAIDADANGYLDRAEFAALYTNLLRQKQPPEPEPRGPKPSRMSYGEAELGDAGGPAAHVDRLIHVQKVGRRIKFVDVPCVRASLTPGDAFVLDGGEVIYVWFGEECSPFEKQAANQHAEDLEAKRGGRAHASHDLDDAFWAKLGGEGPMLASAD